jgi:hypothetical protein
VDWVHLNIKKIRGETEKAFKVQLESDGDAPGQLLWIPKSVIADADDYEEDDKDCTISVEAWWAEKNDLEDS